MLFKNITNVPGERGLIDASNSIILSKSDYAIDFRGKGGQITYQNFTVFGCAALSLRNKISTTLAVLRYIWLVNDPISLPRNAVHVPDENYHTLLDEALGSADYTIAED